MLLFRSIPLLGCVLAQTDDEATHLLQTATVRQHSAMSGIAKNENVEDGCYFGICRVYAPADGWSKECWEQKDSYYVGEGHGSTNECFQTLAEAMDACDTASDCGAVATQSNVGNGCYRVTHGGPTWHIWADWQRYSLRAWARKGGKGQGMCTSSPLRTTTTTTTTTASTTKAPATTTAAGGVIEDGVCHGTEDISEGTSVADSPCFDADTGFGPGFSCDTTKMWCGHDSGDGLVVGQCCPKKCRAECEQKKKNGDAEGRNKAEKERKKKRREDESARKSAEKERKKKRKQDEWQNKRADKEGKNKKAEDENKEKNNWAEKKRKNERKWKKGLKDRKEKANKRERTRKSERANKESKNKNGQANNQAERDRKEKRKKKKGSLGSKEKGKKEKRQKKKQNKGRKGRKGRKPRKGKPAKGKPDTTTTTTTDAAQAVSAANSNPSTQDEMIAAGFDWKDGCPGKPSGTSFKTGMWCPRTKQLKIAVPISGGKKECEATFTNGDTHPGDSPNYVKLLQNGNKIAEAGMGATTTAKFTYEKGDTIEIMEEFAIIKLPDGWLKCK